MIELQISSTFIQSNLKKLVSHTPLGAGAAIRRKLDFYL